MSIKKVYLDETDDECISCGLCESIASMVFRVPNKMEVIPGVDYNEYEDEIKEAVESCPTNVIKYE